jgi:hypothetical protein
MPAPKTSVDKTVQATEPQFLGTSCLQHTGSTFVTDAVHERRSPACSSCYSLPPGGAIGYKGNGAAPIDAKLFGWGSVESVLPQQIGCTISRLQPVAFDAMFMQHLLEN